MRRLIIIQLLALAAGGYAQTPPQIPSTTELMQTRGAINTALGEIATLACIAAPGNTAGYYGQQCQTPAGSRYSCNNSTGCAVAADWVTGSSSVTYPGAGVVSSTGSAWGSSYAVGSAANDLVQLNASGQLPAVSAALLNNFPAALMTTSTGLTAGQMPALTGDATSVAGSAATTVAKVNGGSVPANSALLGTNSTSQLIAQTMWGAGAKPVAAAALGVSGDCVEWSSVGIGDTGAPCGAGSGVGANALGYYFVLQAANEPANAVNLGTLNTGLLKISVAGGIATPSNAAAGTDYVTPSGSIAGTAGNVTGTVAVANGGTGVAGALSGLVRGSSPAMTAAELSGDAITSGSNVVTVARVNGTGVPVNASADQVLGTTGSATGAWLSIPNCGTGSALQYSTSTHAFSCGSAGGGSTRTWPFMFSGMGQAGVSGFAANLPSSGAPTPTNSGGAMPIAVLEWPTAQSAYYAWWTWTLPAGYAPNGAIGYSVESRCNATACDSTHNNVMTLGLGCSAGAALDAPAIVNAGAISIQNSAGAAQTVTTGTLTPNSGGLPACAAGNRVWARMIVDTNTNSLTGPFDLVSVTFSVQGGM